MGKDTINSVNSGGGDYQPISPKKPPALKGTAKEFLVVLLKNAAFQAQVASAVATLNNEERWNLLKIARATKAYFEKNAKAQDSDVSDEAAEALYDKLVVSMTRSSTPTDGVEGWLEWMGVYSLLEWLGLGAGYKQTADAVQQLVPLVGSAQVTTPETFKYIGKKLDRVAAVKQQVAESKAAVVTAQTLVQQAQAAVKAQIQSTLKDLGFIDGMIALSRQLQESATRSVSSGQTTLKSLMSTEDTCIQAAAMIETQINAVRDKQTELQKDKRDLEQKQKDLQTEKHKVEETLNQTNRLLKKLDSQFKEHVNFSGVLAAELTNQIDPIKAKTGELDALLLQLNTTETKIQQGIQALSLEETALRTPLASLNPVLKDLRAKAEEKALQRLRVAVHEDQTAKRDKFAAEVVSLHKAFVAQQGDLRQQRHAEAKVGKSQVEKDDFMDRAADFFGVSSSAPKSAINAAKDTMHQGTMDIARKTALDLQRQVKEAISRLSTPDRGIDVSQAAYATVPEQQRREVGAQVARFENTLAQVLKTLQEISNGLTQELTALNGVNSTSSTLSEEQRSQETKLATQFSRALEKTYLPKIDTIVSSVNQSLRT